jgi:hypothetical protein
MKYSNLQQKFHPVSVWLMIIIMLTCVGCGLAFWNKKSAQSAPLAEQERQYLVVCSTGGLEDKTKKEEDVPRGYIVYPLPK